MTETQSGQGATPERLKKSKIETIETSRAGEFAQINVWPDAVKYMIDKKMLDPRDEYGWSAYSELKNGKGGTGSGDSEESWGHQEWLVFCKIIGNQHLLVLNTLAEWPVSAQLEALEWTNWRLAQCMPRIKQALSSSLKAAQKAREQIVILKLAQKPKL